jgi:predicted transcriptional regulator
MTVKESMRAIADSLPEDATWDEAQYQLYVRSQIEKGLADAEAGRLIDTDELQRRFESQKQALRDK